MKEAHQKMQNYRIKYEIKNKQDKIKKIADKKEMEKVKQYF